MVKVSHATGILKMNYCTMCRKNIFILQYVKQANVYSLDDMVSMDPFDSVTCSNTRRTPMFKYSVFIYIYIYHRQREREIYKR